MLILRTLVLRAGFLFVIGWFGLGAFSIIVTVHVYTSYRDWTRESARFNAFSSGPQPATCQTIKRRCEDEAERREAELSTQLTVPKSPKEHERVQIDKFLLLDDCEMNSRKQLQVDCAAWDPGSAGHHFRTTLDFQTIAFQSAALLIAIAIPIVFIRLFVAEQHRGWRRIALTLPPIAGGAISYYAWLNEWDWREIVVGTLLCIIGTFSGVLSGRRAFQWVREGFTSTELNKQQSPGHAATALEPTIPNMKELRIINLGKVTGVVAILLAGILTAPEKTFQTVVATSVSGTIIIAAVYFWRLVIAPLKGKND